MPTHYLAELNIAQLLAPLDDPMIADFKNALSHINALGENSPGFVWRLKDDSGNSMAFRPYEDPNIAINFSVWENIESLYEYAYATEHTDFFRRRREWFSKMATPSFVLWWHPAEQMPPTLEEAKARLDHLNEHGATPYAFTFKKRFSLQEALDFAAANP